MAADFQEETATLAEKLNDSQFRTALQAEYQDFLQAHSEDSSLLRFHYHKLNRLEQRLDELNLPLREYQSAMTMPPVVRQFITDDEINASLSGGSGISGGKARIYEYWQEGHSAKEKADFLKNEYGTGDTLTLSLVQITVVKITMQRELSIQRADVITSTFHGHRLLPALIC